VSEDGTLDVYLLRPWGSKTRSSGVVVVMRLLCIR
jgi:hypothetical protein